MKRVAIHARYSSDRQNEKSADDQIEACRRYAEREDWAVVSTYKDEAVSLDRLSRDQGDTAKIRKRLKVHRVDIVTLSDGTIDTIKAGMRGLLSEVFLDDLRAK